MIEDENNNDDISVSLLYQSREQERRGYILCSSFITYFFSVELNFAYKTRAARTKCH